MIAIRRGACRGLSIKVALQVFSLMKDQSTDFEVHLFGHGLIPQFLDIFQMMTTPESVIRRPKLLSYCTKQGGRRLEMGLMNNLHAPPLILDRFLSVSNLPTLEQAFVYEKPRYPFVQFKNVNYILFTFFICIAQP